MSRLIVPYENLLKYVKVMPKIQVVPFFPDMVSVNSGMSLCRQSIAALVLATKQLRNAQTQHNPRLNTKNLNSRLENSIHETETTHDSYVVLVPFI